MPTLYLRNVPDDVIARLEQIAAVERSSVSAVAVRELDMVSRRAGNAGLLDALPDTGLETEDLVAQLSEGRAER